METRLIGAIAMAVCAAGGAFAQDTPLLDWARGHVQIAEADESRAMLWGRLGGSEAERASARLFLEQIKPYLDSIHLEDAPFDTYRPLTWDVSLATGEALRTAVPAPFDAWFPDLPDTPIVVVDEDDEWSHATGKWIFLQATTARTPALSSVRQKRLYQKAVEAGAAGFIFSIPLPNGGWKAAVPVDKPFTKRDTLYPDHRRPIPAFCISSEEAPKLIASAESGIGLASSIHYDPELRQEGLNTVGYLAGSGDSAVLLLNHLDSFFQGANDDASGIAVTVGLAKALSEMPKTARKASFIFAGISAHHDEGAGMRAFVDADPERVATIEAAILLEHIDAHHGDDAGAEGWAPDLNNYRAAYVGGNGWPGIDSQLGALVVETGVMTRPAILRRDCIADLYVICEDVQPFCLMQAPPYYHTNHDTMDKLTEDGLRNGLEFHLRLLEEAGYIEERE